MSLPYGEILKYKPDLQSIYNYPEFLHEYPLILSKLGNGYKMLDFGCGNGQIYNQSLLASGLDIEYIGIDNDPSLQGNVNFPLYKSIEELEEAGYTARYFDGLLMLNVLEHLKLDEAWKILSDINPYIDGDIFIMTPNARCFDFMFVDPQHVAFYDYTFLYGLLKVLGFNSISLWRGKGIHRHRKLLYDQTKNPDFMNQNNLQEQVSIALGLDWFGNILMTGDRHEGNSD